MAELRAFQDCNKKGRGWGWMASLRTTLKKVSFGESHENPAFLFITPVTRGLGWSGGVGTGFTLVLESWYGYFMGKDRRRSLGQFAEPLAGIAKY